MKQVEIRMINVGKGYVVLKDLHPTAEGIDLAVEQKKYWLRRMIFGGVVGCLIRCLSSYCETRFIAKRLFRRAISLPFYIGVHEATLKRGKSVDKVTR